MNMDVNFFHRKVSAVNIPVPPVFMHDEVKSNASINKLLQ